MHGASHILMRTFPHPIRGDMIVKLVESELLQEFSETGSKIKKAEDSECPTYIVRTRGSAMLPLPQKYCDRPIRICLHDGVWNPARDYKTLTLSVSCYRRSLLSLHPSWQALNLDEARFVRIRLESALHHLRTRLGWMEQTADHSFTP